MSTEWRDEKWMDDPVACHQCGTPDLIPIPMTSLGVPYWALPEHDTSQGDYCRQSLWASPDQGSLLTDEDDFLSKLPSDPRDLLTESQHSELRDDLARLADIRKRTNPPPDSFPMSW